MYIYTFLFLVYHASTPPRLFSNYSLFFPSTMHAPNPLPLNPLFPTYFPPFTLLPSFYSISSLYPSLVNLPFIPSLPLLIFTLPSDYSSFPFPPSTHLSLPSLYSSSPSLPLLIFPLPSLYSSFLFPPSTHLYLPSLYSSFPFPPSITHLSPSLPLVTFFSL